MTRKYPSQKGAILASAEKLILEKGIGSFKTDALIEASGLSRGGFFYHFKSLDDLLFELGKKISEEFYSEIEKMATNDPVAIGRYIRAYIRVSLLGSPVQRKKAIAMSRIFFEILLSNPKLMTRLKKENSRNHRAIEEVFSTDQLPPLQSFLIQSATDGVWINESLGLTETSAKMREGLCKLLLTLTERPVKDWGDSKI